MRCILVAYACSLSPHHSASSPPAFHPLLSSRTSSRPFSNLRPRSVVRLERKGRLGRKPQTRRLWPSRGGRDLGGPAAVRRSSRRKTRGGRISPRQGESAESCSALRISTHATQNRRCESFIYSAPLYGGPQPSRVHNSCTLTPRRHFSQRNAGILCPHKSLPSIRRRINHRGGASKRRKNAPSASDHRCQLPKTHFYRISRHCLSYARFYPEVFYSIYFCYSAELRTPRRRVK